MPGGNKAGPLGMGPMTGRRAGYCAGFGGPGYANARAWGGRGHRHWFWARFGTEPGQPWAGSAPAGPLEMDILRHQSDWLKEQLDAVSRRISELEQTE